MDVFLLAPFRDERPPPAATKHLDFDDPWLDARDELGPLAPLFMQDAHNLRVQKGLEAARHTHVTFARYQETKIRHFHTLLDRFVSA